MRCRLFLVSTEQIMTLSETQNFPKTGGCWMMSLVVCSGCSACAVR